MAGPIFIKQLDGSSQAGANCGMAAAAMGVSFATQGKTPSPTEMRKRAATGNGATNTADQQKAVQSFDTASETGGRKRLVYTRRLQAPWSELWDALGKGYCVNLQMHYGIFNKESSHTGDPNFTGMHSVTLYGRRITTSKMKQIRLYDPLFDGRRSGISKGPQWVQESDLRKAAQGFSKKTGTWTGGIIKISPKLSVPAPKPPEPKPPIVEPEPPQPIPEPPVQPNRESIYLDALIKTRSSLLDALAIVNGALPELMNTFMVTEVGAMDAVVEQAIPVENLDEDEDEETEPPEEGEEIYDGDEQVVEDEDTTEA